MTHDREVIRDAVDGMLFMPFSHVSLGSSYVTRVVTDDPDPSFVRRPVGFVIPTAAPEREPLTWEGDQA